MSSIDNNIKYVKGVGEKRATLLEKLDVKTVYDAVHLYPRNYLNFSECTPISELKNGETCCVRAFVGCGVEKSMIRKGMTIFKTVVTDGEGVLHLTIFNNQFLADRLKEGMEFFFLGKVSFNPYTRHFEMNSPIVEKVDEALSFEPIYPLTAGISSKVLEKIIRNSLQIYANASPADLIPDFVRREFKLCHEQYALKNIHFPSTMKDVEIARRRLIFEELLVLQSGMMMLRKQNKNNTDIIIKEDKTTEFIDSLPFQLTGAQQRAISECVADLKKGEQMNRLVQGDVGSGKTVVSAALIYAMVKNGFQCALMAPTEILAKQHYETLKKLFGEKIKVCLLTGGATAKEKKVAKLALESGEADVAVGTHALITDDVRFSSLGLVVTDEQHRFGVRQRSMLGEKGNSPHVLVMSATPIPRTLSLIIYGDLDISIINELPKGRQKIDTYAVDSSYHKRIYSFVKKHLDRGLRAYIVCPAVEESELELTSAIEHAKELSENEFSDYEVGLLHGKMKPKEKAQIMSDFASGKIRLLVSTTVIEVGIDVPEAVLIIIENAERFGLSQLHQLRGRVGRGTEKSTCILVSDNKSENVSKRLEIMCKTNDGFKIADEDLKLRGPGDFFGSRQHGLPEMKIADLLEDMVTLNQSKQAAKAIFEKDPELKTEENKMLKAAVTRLFEKTGGGVLN